MQKAWAARKHDESLYTGTVLGTRDQAVSTKKVPARELFILVSLQYMTFSDKKGDLLK